MTDQTAHVDVVARRITYTFQYPPPLPTPTSPVDSNVSSPPDQDYQPPCVDVRGMSDKDKIRVLLRSAAADVRRAIRAMPNQRSKYAAYLYIDSGAG